uniref:1-phosphatidylinositol-5-phosphate 4-kinase n=1 Tax=Romanomermis culicivorax TaxID=13658 RepID=A0A915I1Y9_ROMCU
MSSSAKKVIKKSTTKYRSKKPIVPKWKLFRASEPFMSVFMWGINHSICELSHVPPPTLLLPDDFKAFSKVKIDNHAFNKDNMPSHFKIKEYCPNVFRNLREKFGIQEHDYLKSLTKSQPEVMESSGKSQAKFYFSYDGSLVVKSLCAEEVAEVHSILQDYHEYVVEKGGQTLLPQFLGLYRLTVENVETYLIVMRNIFGQRYNIHKKYDLKGSTVQRCASDKEKQKDLPTYKDMDFIDDGCKLYLPEDAGKTLVKLLTADCEFLSKLRLMDYSVLVGIHECAKSPPPAATAPGDEVFGVSGGGDSSEPDVASLNMSDDDLGCGDAPKREIYFIGLVDILTYYGMKKKTASAAKTVKYGAAEAENISTVKPHQYARRLIDFMTKSIDPQPTILVIDQQQINNDQQPPLSP